jgi:hypothetical protein
MSNYESDYKPPESQVAAPPQGSNGSIYSSVGAISKLNAETQNNLNKIGGRRRIRRSRRHIKGGAPPGPVIAHAEITNAPAPVPATTQAPVSTNNTITVPVVKPLYPETGTGSQTTASNVANSTKVGAELNANKQYDSCVGQGATCGQVTVTSGQKGGRKTRGGWPHWGCMSGGKYRRNRTNKRKRTNKKRRTTKRKGTNKRR